MPIHSGTLNHLLVLPHFYQYFNDTYSSLVFVSPLSLSPRYPTFTLFSLPVPTGVSVLPSDSLKTLSLTDCKSTVDSPTSRHFRGALKDLHRLIATTVQVNAGRLSLPGGTWTRPRDRRVGRLISRPLQPRRPKTQVQI